MFSVRRMAVAGMVLAVVLTGVWGRAEQSDPAVTAADSDGDGMNDALEQVLLEQFAPRFQADAGDCAGVPASFVADRLEPVVAAEDGTVYGVATPRTVDGLQGPLAELRYFHLWKVDCGRMGHPLDAEHVSVLVEKDGDRWKALYWYAAAA